MTYQEILDQVLSDGKWHEEDYLASFVVKEKYVISKASQSRKNGVLNLLKIGHSKGQYVKGFDKESYKIFWAKWNGVPDKFVLLHKGEIEEIEDSRMLLRRARENIAKLELLLSDICERELVAKYGNDWGENSNNTTIQNFNKTLIAVRNNPWSVGKEPKLLDFATFDSFASIINNFWRDVFEPIFRNQWLIVSKLQELNYYRNAIQHNNELSDIELVFFNSSIEIFIKKFGNNN